MTGRAEDCGHRLECLIRIVDVLEHPVAQNQVDRVGRNVIEKIGCITLDAVDTSVWPGFHPTPVERSQRIGARVDDRDPMPQRGQPNGVAACAASQVEHVQTASVTRELGRIDDGLPHQLGADRTHDRHCATADTERRRSVQPHGREHHLTP